MLCALVFTTPVWALTPSQKSSILENFKNQEYRMIFESDGIVFSEDENNVFNSTQKINIYNSIGEKVQTKREYLEYQSEKLISRVQSLEESITELNTDIDDMVREVNKINDNIIDTKKLVEINKAKIEVLKSKIDRNQEVLLEYMIYLYKK